METGFLSERLESPITEVFATNPGWIEWLIDTLLYVFVLIFAVVALLLLMDVLKALGFIDLLNKLLRPLLSLVGVDRQLAPVATTGVLLGVVYGGALMIDEVRASNYSKRAVFTAMLLVSLMHALIEDTLVVLAIGANLWIVLIGRVPFALLFIFLFLRVPSALSATSTR